MNYGLFGRYSNSRPGTCSRVPQTSNQQGMSDEPYRFPFNRECPLPDTNKLCKEKLFLKSTPFGGLVLPEGTEKRATFHVASLSLDTSLCRDILVQLNFSCNIVTNNLKVRLRFQIFKQDYCQSFSIPMSAGILYFRDRQRTEANSFTVSACDCDSSYCACCYSVFLTVEDFGPSGNMIIENPVILATILEK